MQVIGQVGLPGGRSPAKDLASLYCGRKKLPRESVVIQVRAEPHFLKFCFVGKNPMNFSPSPWKQRRGACDN